MKFNELVLSKELHKALADMGFINPTDIQKEAIPVLLEGHDVIGQAQTGTGKTAAFGIPAVEICKSNNTGVEVLIMAPTRELAVQIVDDLRDISAHKKIRIATIIGGVDYGRQIKMLRDKPNIVVATPGRVIDHLENRKFKLDNLKMFILDEADEMLKVGFKEEIDKIITYLPKKKQSALFSATLNKDVRRIADSVMYNPKEVLVSSGLTTVDTIDQYAIIVSEKDKLKTLVDILDINANEKCLIFGRTKKRADELSVALNAMGYSARALHGDLNQRQRQLVVKEFKLGAFDILVATDVAARGIDISGIKFVYNFDLPQEVEYYVHRIGRTGRAGQKGVSFSFLRQNEIPHLRKIEEETSSKVKIVLSPTKDEINSARQNRAAEKILSMKDRKLNRHYGFAEVLIEQYGAKEIISAALEVLVDRKKGVLPELTGEPPVRIKYETRNRFNKKDSKRDGNHRGGGGGRRRKRNRSNNNTRKYK
ncbi:DEAD/DEAH box helicase [Mycoplasmatota bacterium WC44]